MMTQSWFALFSIHDIPAHNAYSETQTPMSENAHVISSDTSNSSDELIENTE